MKTRWRQLRLYLTTHGLMPTSRLAKFTLYLLGVNVFLVAYRWVLSLMKKQSGVDDWITFLAYVVVCLGVILESGGSATT